MNIRARVHFASQDYVGLNSLAILRLDNNELTSIGTCYRLATTNDVGRRFVLGCQKPGCYRGKGRAGSGNNSNGLRKRVAVDQLRVSAEHVPVEDGNPQMVEVGIKIEKKRFGIRPSVSSRFFL